MSVPSPSPRSTAASALDALQARLAGLPTTVSTPSQDEVLKGWAADGTLVPLAELAKHWGKPIEPLVQDYKTGRLLALEVDGKPLVPAPLLDSTPEAVAAVTAALGDTDPVSATIFWLRPHGALAGRSIATALNTGECVRVLQLARAFASENRPEDSSPKRSILDLAGLLTPPKGVPVSIEEMNPFRDRPTADDVPALIRELYAIVAKLVAIFPGRHFTPDGHLVGSLGEALASHYYGVVLCKASNQGYDGLRDGKQVEVKTTQGSQVPLSCSSEHLLVFRVLPDGTFEECFNGPGYLAWALVSNRKPAKRGQHQVTLSALKRVMAMLVRQGQPLEPVRTLPEGTKRALPGKQAQ